MEPIEYLRILRRRWWIIACAVFVAVAAVIVTTPSGVPQQPTAPSYKATNTLLQNPDDRAAGAKATQNLSSLAFFVTAGEVPKRAAEILSYEGDPAILALDVRATADTTVGAIQIEVVDKDGERAAELANVFAEEFLKFIDEREIGKYQRSVELAQERVRELENRVRDLDGQLFGAEGAAANLIRAERDANVRQYGVAYERLQQLINQGAPAASFYSVQPATPIPVFTTSFRPPSSRGARLAIVGLFALFVGTAIAFLFDRVDTRVRSKQAAESLFGMPVIAEVPALRRPLRKRRQIALITAPAGVVAEAYRLVRTTVLFTSSPARSSVNGHRNGNGKHLDPQHLEELSASSRSWRSGGSLVVIVTSPGPGEGKTTTSANLAAAFAEWGRSVLVLSCDLRRPEVHRYLGVDAQPGRGIVDLLLGTPAGGSLDLESILIDTNVPGVRIAPAGTKVENPGELLVRAPELVTAARILADVVVIDTGPLLLMSDATELVPLSDVTIVVARDGRTGAEPARRASELLKRLEAPTLGVVLVGARQLATGRRRYYRYRYTKPGAGLRDRLSVALHSDASVRDRLALLFAGPREIDQQEQQERPEMTANEAATHEEEAITALPADFVNALTHALEQAPHPIVDVTDTDGDVPPTAPSESLSEPSWFAPRPFDGDIQPPGRQP